MYAALGDSFTSLVLDWYATLSVMFSLFLFFLRHTNTVIMMAAAVMSTNSVPATPTPTKSVMIALVLCGIGVVETSAPATPTLTDNDTIAPMLCGAGVVEKTVAAGLSNDTELVYYRAAHICGRWECVCVCVCVLLCGENR